MYAKFAALTALVASAAAQQACSLTTETHPSMSWGKCTSGGNCSKVAGTVAIDANWRWLHSVSGSTNCYDGNKWNTAICNSATSCASACCVDGADYTSTYGATASGDALSLKFVTKGQYSTNVGSRLYLMESATKYQGMFFDRKGPAWQQQLLTVHVLQDSSSSATSSPLTSMSPTSAVA